MSENTAKVVKGWGYVIACPIDGEVEDSLALTKDRAWEKFCYPALRREAYECKESGYRVKRVPIERVKINGQFIRLARRLSSPRMKNNSRVSVSGASLTNEKNKIN